jgi:MoaA/NifB/PqqE/SkfB family radical SAM enzyme
MRRNKLSKLMLDGTKIAWYTDRLAAWERGERIAPVTIDMALTQACNYKCKFCYGQLQKNKGYVIEQWHIDRFLKDASAIGVKGVSLVSDGESTLSPIFAHTIITGSQQGLSMACGTNGYKLDREKMIAILPHLTYLRVNISAGEADRYYEIMGSPKDGFTTVRRNIRDAVWLKQSGYHNCTIGMQMVLMPEFADQIIPLASLALELGVDYLIIKHCADDEHGTLGVKYDKYQDLFELLKRAEGMSNSTTRIVIKWSKICDANIRTYSRCLGVPFMLQISGTGLVAPCGMFFGEAYERYHMGNITLSSFRQIWESDEYWRIIDELAGSSFDARRDCGCLCLQHSLNKALDNHTKGIERIEPADGEPPDHISFI